MTGPGVTNVPPARASPSFDRTRASRTSAGPGEEDARDDPDDDGCRTRTTDPCRAARRCGTPGCSRAPSPSRLPPARAVEGRRHRAAQRQRAVEAGGRRPRRARAHRAHLRRGRLREHRPDRPARPLPLVGPLHAAQARHRRRQDRHARAARARGRVLHAPRAHRRRAADHRAAARDRAASRPSSGATPPTSPTARTSSSTGSASRTCPRSGAASRASASARPRRAATCRASCSARRSPASPPTSSSTHTPQIDEITSRFIGDESLANLPRKFKTAITGHPSQDVVHEINDVAFVAVDHPELGIGYDLWVGGGLSTAPRLAERLGVFVAPEQRRRGLARRRPDLPRLRLPAPAQQGAAEVPARRLGHREVPPGARDRVPRAHRCPTAPRLPSRSRTATTSASTARRTAGSTSASRRSSAGSPARRSRSSPTSSTRTAPRACARRRTRSS